MTGQNIWNLYGLKDNPFTTDPLSMYGDGLPIKESFFGREEDIKKLNRIIHSNKTSRILVYGEVGIGKTTFTNYVKYEAVIDNTYFTPLGELSIDYTWTPESFMLNTISIVWTAIDRNKEIREKITPDLKKKLNIIFGMDRGNSMGVSGSVLGIGGGYDSGQSYGLPMHNSHNIKILFQDLLDELLRIGYMGVLIHYNNLELIQDKNENQLKKIMNGIRDFMQVKGAHFIFVSDRTLYEQFEQLPRVEDIFQVPILLHPFKFDEIKQIINKRIKLLTINDQISPIIPHDDDTLKILFDLYDGNLRGILRGLDCAINDCVHSRPIKLTPVILKTSLFKYAQNRFLMSLGSNEDANTIKILKRILEKRETTNKLLSEHLKMLPQNVSASLTKLREAGAIRLSREEGRSRYYLPSQEALWLLLRPTSDTEA